jgi:hypothetical protein
MTKLEFSTKSLNFISLFPPQWIYFQTFRVISEEGGGDINNCDFFILSNEKCQHIEDLHIQCFLIANALCCKRKHK